THTHTLCLSLPVCVCLSLSFLYLSSIMHAHTWTDTYTLKCPQMLGHTSHYIHMHARTHTCAHTRTHTQTHTLHIISPPFFQRPWLAPQFHCCYATPPLSLSDALIRVVVLNTVE